MMKMITLYKKIALLCILLGGFVLHVPEIEAQQQQQQPAPAGKKRLMQFKKLKLIEILDLDDTAAEKFFTKYNSEQKKVEQARQALDQAIRDLQKAIDNNSSTIKDVTNTALQRHQELQNAISTMLQSIRPLLNDKQYAQYLIFEGKFQEDVRKKLLEFRRDLRRE